MPYDLTTKKTELVKLVNDHKTLHAEMTADAAKQTTDNRTKLDNMFEAGKALRAEIDQLEGMNEMDTYLNKPAAERKSADAITPPAQVGNPNEGAEAKMWGGYRTPGEMYIKSDAFKSAGALRSGMAALEVGVLPYSAKTVVDISLSGAGASVLRADRLTEWVDIARMRPPSIVDLVNHSQTSLAAVDYVRMTARQDLSAVVAEGAAKPQGDLTFDTASAPVKVIAEWIKATRQILDDAPQIRNTIDTELMYQIKNQLEYQIVSGDGTGDNFTGILSTSGIQVRQQGVTSPALANDTIADTIRRAMVDLSLELYVADGVALAPADAAKMELDKGSDGHYTKIYDSVGNRVWRIPVVESHALTEGTGLVCNWMLAATLWDRMAAQVMVGYINDDFTKNKVTILAELRAAFAVKRPKAVVKLTSLA